MLVLFPGSISFFLFGAFLVCSVMKCSMGMSWAEHIHLFVFLFNIHLPVCLLWVSILLVFNGHHLFNCLEKLVLLIPLKKKGYWISKVSGSCSRIRADSLIIFPWSLSLTCFIKSGTSHRLSNYYNYNNYRHGHNLLLNFFWLAHIGSQAVFTALDIWL